LPGCTIKEVFHMIGTLAGVTLIVTAASVFRNYKQWDAYHKAHISRSKMVNGVFVTLAALALTIGLFVIR
jgi:hypothetical protein